MLDPYTHAHTQAHTHLYVHIYVGVYAYIHNTDFTYQEHDFGKSRSKQQSSHRQQDAF